MARTTVKDLDQITETLNANVKELGIEFQWNTRNGYTAIDYFQTDDNGRRTFDSYRSGLTKGEAAEIMKAMNWIVWHAKKGGAKRIEWLLKYVGA
jgi:xylose isomerase